MKMGGSNRSEVLALTLLAAAEQAHVFSQFEPSIFTIRNLANPQGTTGDIRIGYVPALILGLSMAGAIAWIIKSKLPLLAALATAAFTISIYELAIASGTGSGSSQ